MSTPDTLAPICLTDNDGDALVTAPQPCGGMALLVPTSGAGVELTRHQVTELANYLADHLDVTDPHNLTDAYDLPNPTRDGYDWPPVDTEQLAEPLAAWERELLDTVGEPDTEPVPDTITREAENAVYGDRNDDYGHPREDFTRTAVLWTGLLQHKLADGAYVEPEDVARCQIAVKLARDVHAPKRDNRVDMAGYALTLDRLQTGR